MSPKYPEEPTPQQNFRFDAEFVKLISTQAEQKVMLGVLQDKVDDFKSFNSENFATINKNLKELSVNISTIQNNCIAHKILDKKENQIVDEKSTGMIFGMKPDFFKGLAFIIIVIVGYLLGIPVKF